jgi:hypothetical protein
MIARNAAAVALMNPAKTVADGGRMTSSSDRKGEPVPAAIESAPVISELA